jgi:hypothetical protein
MAHDDRGGQIEQHSRFHFPNLVLTRLRNGERLREGLQEGLGVFTWKASTPGSSSQVIMTSSCQSVCTHASTGPSNAHVARDDFRFHA